MWSLGHKAESVDAFDRKELQTEGYGRRLSECHGLEGMG